MLENQDQSANDNTNADVGESIEDKFYPDAEEAKKSEEDKVDVIDSKDEQSKDGDKEESDDKSEDAEDKSKDEESKDKEESDEEASGAPDEYSLKFDDSLIGDTQLERVTSFAKDSNLTNEEAQQFIEMQEGAIADYRDSTVEAHNKVVEAWANDIKNDKDFGGDNFKENSDYAMKVSEKYGTQEFREMLNNTGYGNHPELFKTFASIGKAMANDKMVNSNQESKPEKSIEELMYGKT